jgi:proteasome lid subunit RPN8/RPN11
MLKALVNFTGRLLNDLHRSLFREHLPPSDSPEPTVGAPRRYERLARVLLTDEVNRTLFEEYAEHRKSERGDEETGWVLLGIREEQEAVVLATLPAGTQRDAGVAHVSFNSNGQALASRIVRQSDRRLTILGIVHTHPGSLRHPSDGDFQGDSLWVGRLRGGEGIFGIGTADSPPAKGTLIARQPQSHVQCLGELRLTWYSLKEGEKRYRPLPVTLTLGPDLARPLHFIWSMIEAHAEQLDRLCRQQARVTFEVIPGAQGPALAVNILLAEPEGTLRLVLEKEEVRYYLVRGGEVFALDCAETQLDRGVYLLLAELAGQS